jgi:preprotein translocase subunit YajC
MDFSSLSTSAGWAAQPVQVQSGTSQPSAPAQGAPQQGAPPGSMVTMLLPLLVLVPILFMSFRRQKKEQEARSKLKKGDRVVTQGGLVGELVELEDRVSKVKIAPGTTVQVLTSSVSTFEAAGAAKTDKELADLKDAKAATDKK